MSYFFPSDLSHSLNGQPPRSPLAKPLSQTSLYQPQDTTFSYFPLNQAKMIHEDPYFCSFTPLSHPSTDGSTHYDLQTFGMPSPAFYPTYQNKPSKVRTSLSSNFESNVTSLGSLSELPTLDPFREQNQLYFADNCLASQEPMENQARYTHEPLMFTADLFLEEKECLETEEGSPELFSSPSEVTEVSGTSEEKSYLARPDLKGWNEEDEKLLRKLAVQYKYDWKKVAKKFANKKYTPHFLKMRFKGYDEGPVPKRVKFTHEEDLKIATLFDTYGVDWDKMVSHFPNRTSIMLKNRFYSYIRKNNRLESLLQESGVKQGENNEELEGCREELTQASDCSSKFELKELARNNSASNVSENENFGKNIDENALLRSQLKSLKSLYLVTYRELNKLKEQNQKLQSI